MLPFYSAAQSGYVPTIIYQLSRIYKPTEITTRTAIFISMASASAVISGPLAYGTSSLEGLRGLHGWQYLFIVEGSFTVLMAVVSYFAIYENLDHVSWLTNNQRRIQRIRTVNSSSDTPITILAIMRVIFDAKVWLVSLVNFLNVICVVSMSVYMPVIIAGTRDNAVALTRCYPISSSPLFRIRLPCIAITTLNHAAGPCSCNLRSSRWHYLRPVRPKRVRDHGRVCSDGNRLYCSATSE